MSNLSEPPQADIWELMKNEATAEMKAGQFSHAAEKYENVIAHLDTVGSDADDEESRRRRSMLLACLNNVSMAYLKLEQHRRCVDACTRGLSLDDGNLKALYRRAQAYHVLAHGECTVGKVQSTTTEATAETDAFWPLAMQDVQLLLERQPDSQQAKDLKQEIRFARRDQEAQRALIKRYGRDLAYRGPDAGKPAVGTVSVGETVEGSVFKGFPVLQEEGGSKPRRADAPCVTGSSTDGDVTYPRSEGQQSLEVAYETAVAKDEAHEVLEGHGRDVLGEGSDFTKRELAQQVAVAEEQKRAAEANHAPGGYSFLNAAWTPPSEDDGAGAAEVAASVSAGVGLIGAPLGAPPTAASSQPGGSTSRAGGRSAAVAAATTGSSIQSLMAARKKSKAAAAGSGGDSMVKAAHLSTAAPAASPEVSASLTALQQLEQEAARKVQQTAAAKEAAARERVRGTSRLSRKSAMLAAEQQRIRAEPTVSSAWDELMQGEQAAQSKYKEQLMSRGINTE